MTGCSRRAAGWWPSASDTAVTASAVAAEIRRLRMNDRENNAIWTSNNIRRRVRIAPLAASHVSHFFLWLIGSEVRSEDRDDADRAADVLNMARERPALNLQTGKVGHDACEQPKRAERDQLICGVIHQRVIDASRPITPGRAFSALRRAFADVRVPTADRLRDRAPPIKSARFI
jgi:hypothetical protein